MSLLRYFPNPKPDYEVCFGLPQIPERHILETIKDMTIKIKTFKTLTETNLGGLYLGPAGIAYMFYYLSKVAPLSKCDNGYLNEADSYLHSAIQLLSRSKYEREDIPSFILGNCGVYAIAAAVYKSTGDEGDSRRYRHMYYQAAKICKDPRFLSCGSDELFVGRSGYILGALWLSVETNTPLEKQDIYDLCNIMVQSGRDYARQHNSQCPLMYAYYQVEYLGAAHGLCSILQVLISVPGYLDSHPSEARDIKLSIDFLLSLQTREGNFPTSTDEIGYKAELVHWCHGAGGMVFLMAKSYLVFQEEKYLNSCRLMSSLIWKKGLLKKGPGLCHGVAGNGYVFLLLYRLTKEPIYLHRAIQFYEFMGTEEFRMNARLPDFPYSLYEGMAGTACFLADLTCPLQAKFPFMDIFQ